MVITVVLVRTVTVVIILITILAKSTISMTQKEAYEEAFAARVADVRGRLKIMCQMGSGFRN